MKLKQYTALFLCGILCLSLCSCKDKDTQQTPQEPTAASENVGENVTLFSRDTLPENTYDGVTLVMDSISAKAGEKEVPVRVMLFNNPGYINCGVRIYYGEGLSPLCESEDKTKCITGDASQGMMTVSAVDTAKRMIGFASAGAQAATNDGMVITVYFDIPSDAKSGTFYPLTLDIQDFKATRTDQLDPTLIQGGIQIE